jgi:acyl-CoA thioesterase
MDFENFLREVKSSGWYQLTGMEPKAEKGKAVVRVGVGEEHLQAYGTVHGGMIATLIDSATGLAVNSLLVGEGKRVVTVELDIKFINPASSKELIAEGKVISVKSSIATAYAEVRGEGELIAFGTATFYILPS